MGEGKTEGIRLFHPLPKLFFIFLVLFILPKQPFPCLNGISLHRRKEVPIDAQGNRDVTVAEQFLNDFNVDSFRQQKSRRAMPQIVKAQGWKTCIPKQLSERFPKMIRMQIASTKIGKHEISILPCVICFLQDSLFHAVLP